MFGPKTLYAGISNSICYCICMLSHVKCNIISRIRCGKKLGRRVKLKLCWTCCLVKIKLKSRAACLTFIYFFLNTPLVKTNSPAISGELPFSLHPEILLAFPFFNAEVLKMWGRYDFINEIITSPQLLFHK